MRHTAIGLFTFLVLTLCTHVPTAWATPSATTSAKRAVELTFLKSQPGQRENLRQFIVLNWFAIDKIAQQRGLMHSYTVLDLGTDDGPWNLIVSVTYTNDQGYDGIREPFEVIRRAHATVRVDGKTLRELGSIVESKRLYENPADASTSR